MEAAFVVVTLENAGAFWGGAKRKGGDFGRRLCCECWTWRYACEPEINIH